MELNSLPKKVDFILTLAAKGEMSEGELKMVESFLPEHSDHPRLGRVFGYTVSDYAFASLKWIGTEEMLRIFNKHFVTLSPERKNEINELIKENRHINYLS